MTSTGNEGTLSVQVGQDGVVVVRGDIDIAGGPILDAALAAITPGRSGPSESLVIDLADVTFIDSSGLRSLLAASRAARARGANVVLRRLGPEVARLLQITGTTDQFTIEAARVTDAALPGPVEIRVPSDPSMSRVLRLAASGIGSLAGLTVDALEDIKIAVSEILLALIEHGGGRAIDVRFVVVAHGVEVHGRTPVERFDADHPDLALCRTVLGAVCAEHGIDVGGGTAHIWALVTDEAPE